MYGQKKNYQREGANRIYSNFFFRFLTLSVYPFLIN